MNRTGTTCWQRILPALVLGFGLQAGANPAQLTPADLETTGVPIALAAEGCNRAFHFTVSRAELRDAYGDHPAPPGQRWLVLDLVVENQMPVDLLYDLGYREDILVASLSRQFYLLVNGRQVARRAMIGGPDAAPDGFTLARWGERLEGRVIYPVPSADVQSLALHYYHDQYAPVVIDLMRRGSDSTPAPAQPIQANDLMEVGVFGVEPIPEWEGRAPPAGMKWMAVDLRGRGHWSIEADALALDRTADPEEQVRLPKVMEYVEAQGLLQIVADGEYAFVREPALGTLAAEPAFLPDAVAGGVGVFPVPVDARSLVLEVHFPEFRGPGIDDPIPESMIFPLEGEASAPAASAPAGSIADEPTPLTIHAVRREDRFGDQTAGPDEQLFVLDASMRNVSPVGGMMNITGRIDLITGDGEEIEPVGLFNAGPMRLAEPFWLPAGGDPRRFQLVYRAPAGAVPAALDYRGVSVNTRLDLP